MRYQIKDSRGSFLWLSSAILERYGSKIGPIGIAVYCALAKYADNDTRESWPSHKTIADLIGTSSRSVKTYINKLASFGLVEVEERFDVDGRRTSNLYILTPPEKWKEVPPTGQEMPIPQAAEIPRMGTPGAYELDSFELDSVNYSSESRDSDSTADADGNNGSGPPSKRELQQAVVKEVTAHFEQVTKLEQPTARENKSGLTQWYNSIREICSKSDWDPLEAIRVVDEALHRLDGLTLSDPHSIIKTARAIIAEKRRASAKPKYETVTIRDPDTGEWVKVEARI